MPYPFSLKNSSDTIYPKDICSKVNVIGQLEFELAYYDSAVNRFNH